MTGLFDTDIEPKKIMVVAPQGSGKSGALASLVCLGYKLRMVDTDKGFRPLRSLLTDYRYPYRKYCEDHKIDLKTAVSAIPVDLEMIKKDVRMGNKNVQMIVPKNELAWDKATGLLSHWIDRDPKTKEVRADYGNIDTWEEDTVLVFDTFGTLAKMAFYNVQALNGRLGAVEVGFDFQRDIGGAQSILTRLLELLYSTTVKCNVIINTHITWVDQRRGFAQSPDQVARGTDNIPAAIPEPDGLPAAIGRALSPQMGKYFNDVFTISVSGSGENVRREISTVPMKGVICKHSAFMKKSYDISTGLAEIFCAIDGKPEPEELIRICGRPTPVSSAATALAVQRPAPLPKPAPKPVSALAAAK